METFADRLAIVTGGGSGMGRELVRQLTADGCHVACCDVDEENLAETAELALADAPDGVKVTVHRADVSDEGQVLAFRDQVADRHETDHINLLFNNAGVGGGGSFVTESRDDWDQTFAICWGGTYHCTRAFLSMLLASDAGHVVNTSSVNGFWASLGRDQPHTAYSAAKFAVKGFSEALLTDFRLNAPHVQVSVFMPGHIGTDIVLNSMKYFGRNPKELTEDQIAQIREQTRGRRIDLSNASDEDVRQGLQMVGEMFRDLAPTTSAQAATIILEGVRAGRWRILVGKDAEVLDQFVREAPEDAYEHAFFDRLQKAGIFSFG